MNMFIYIYYSKYCLYRKAIKLIKTTDIVVVLTWIDELQRSFGQQTLPVLKILKSTCTVHLLSPLKRNQI